MGGVKFILELVKKRKMLVLDVENILFSFKDENKQLLSNEMIEDIKMDYDLVLISRKNKDQTQKLLEENNIDKYFYGVFVNNEEENVTAISQIVKHCPNLSTKYLSTDVQNVINANNLNIEIIGIIGENENCNLMVNNYRHLGVKNIFGDLRNIKTYIKEIEKNDNEN